MAESQTATDGGSNEMTTEPVTVSDLETGDKVVFGDRTNALEVVKIDEFGAVLEGPNGSKYDVDDDGSTRMASNIPGQGDVYIERLETVTDGGDDRENKRFSDDLSLEAEGWKMNVREAIEDLADAGLLTERQAEAYVRREVELEPRTAVAEHMGISPNTLDNTLATAREKIEQAQATADAVDSIRFGDIPDECAECGATLGGSWTTDEEGTPMCFDCAGIEPDDKSETISE